MDIKMEQKFTLRDYFVKAREEAFNKECEEDPNLRDNLTARCLVYMKQIGGHKRANNDQ